MVKSGCRRGAVAFASLLLSLLGALASLPGEAAAPSEYEVKAAFLYHFAKYVEWPPGAANGEADLFVITILGEDPFGGVIDQALEGKTVDGRRVVVRRTTRPEDIKASRILFVSDSEQAQLGDILKRLSGVPTLTVGEMDRFAERGGVIRFRTEKSRIRLEVNLGAAARARLKISSELLKLARIVGEEAG